MKALRLYVGPVARRHLEREGLSAHDVSVITAAAGGPKGLILGPLDRFIFGQWLPGSDQPVDLVGASIGAWRMATGCLNDPVQALERLEHDYIHQDYQPAPGQTRPSAEEISWAFSQGLQSFYGGRIDEVLSHPRYRLHVMTTRGKGVLHREGRWRTPLGYAGAMWPIWCNVARWGPGWSGWCFPVPSKVSYRLCPSIFMTIPADRCCCHTPISWTRCRPVAPFRLC